MTADTAARQYLDGEEAALPSASWFSLGSDLGRDLRNAAAALGDQEIRFLVDSYYNVQDQRKQAAQRRAAAESAGEPSLLLRRLESDTRLLEANLKGALDRWSREQEICQWARSICGIGPVIAAGLAAHIKAEHSVTAGHIWSFAGLNPEAVWGKGEKRPWNAGLKVLCWKIGESFVKVKGREDDFYGKIYEARKALETARNEEGRYADQAAAILKARPGHAQAAIYRQGKLPPGHIHARAKRYAVKLFLAHYQWVLWEITYSEAPRKPYVLEHVPGHSGIICPPNWPMPGKTEKRGRKASNKIR